MLQQRIKPLEIDAKYQNLIKTEDKVVKINAEGLYYKELNCLLRQVITTDIERIELHNVCGQRYLGTGLDTKIQIAFAHRQSFCSRFGFKDVATLIDDSAVHSRANEFCFAFFAFFEV